MKLNKDNVESATKIVGSILTLIGIIVGLWEFNDGQRQNEKMEFKRKMFEKELNTYDELAKITGEIVTAANDSIKFDSLRMQFDRLYYTKMVLSESDSVSSLMIDTRNEFLDYMNHESTLLKVKKRVVLLMEQCKLSLADDWKNLK